jgi:23S rRNA (cytidine1920-2'-O)/16S rRNA (cytidine1409-2'-O)-methyltransferase
MKPKVDRKALDALLVERGLAESVEKARAMILAGEVRVKGSPVHKAGTRLPDDVPIEITSRQQKYASRGGTKLEGALADFGVDPSGKVCVDVGSSTGGFTDCLLQRGAPRVYAVDVNTDQLAWKLRQDPRVIPVRRNARELRPEDVPEVADLVVVDVSFISVAKVLPAVMGAARAGADLLILVKPQFELAREDVRRNGIVRDPVLQEKAVSMVRESAQASGLEILGVRPSRLLGTEGNQEFFLHARKRAIG